MKNAWFVVGMLLRVTLSTQPGVESRTSWPLSRWNRSRTVVRCGSLPGPSTVRAGWTAGGWRCYSLAPASYDSISMHPRPFASLQDERRLSLSGARCCFVSKVRSRALSGSPAGADPPRLDGWRSLHRDRSVLWRPMSLPGHRRIGSSRSAATRATRPFYRACIASFDPFRQDAPMLHRWRCNTRTPRAPSVVSLDEAALRVGRLRFTLRTARTSLPCARQSPRQRGSGFLPASSPVAGLPCGSPNADDAGCVRPTSASHHSVNEHPRLVGSRSAVQFYPAACGERGASRHLSRFGGPRALFRCGAFSSPRRGAWPYLWHPLSPSELSRDASPYFFGGAPRSRRT